jgi:hypothetical protein
MTVTAWRFHAIDVTKVYANGRVRANDQITFEVRPGEVYGLLGPNGAGKSTLLRQVIGLLKPTGGRITLGPYDLVADPDAARQLCSYLPQAQLPIESFRVREAIELTGRIRGGTARAVRRPPTHLPGWLLHLQQVLPFYNMAVVIRAGLTTGLVDHVATSYLVLAGWTVAGPAATGWAIGRRR